MVRVTSADELEVCEEVGRGAFGVVYRGHVRASGLEVAIKQIDLENDPTDLLDILREIQIISECRLPQITSFYGCFVKNYQLWVVMEFADGGSIFDILRPGPMKNEKTIAIILKEVLVALEYLHDQGKIHRDLKSQNILLTRLGNVKLTDFGVSAQLSSNFSRRNTTVGTPYWMAPEVILNSNGGHSFKADLWSLGCCAYELVTGKPPLQRDYPPMRALRHISTCSSDDKFAELIGLDELDISADLCDFLRHCFVVDPTKRYSAPKLSKHRFITSNTVSSEDQAILIRKAITNKQLWDQENQIDKTQKFYIETEIARNQQQWKQSNSPEDKNFPEIQFDFSTIKATPNVKTDMASSASLSSLPIRRGTYRTASKQADLERLVGVELAKILNRALHKLESRANLTTEQYELIESLNELFLNLLSVCPSSEKSEGITGRFIILQYLRYVLKEIMKEGDSTRSLIQRLVFPSSFSNYSKPSDSLTTRRYTSQYDEIESSLLESWIEKMSQS